jgi:hypothetical protein
VRKAAYTVLGTLEIREQVDKGIHKGVVVGGIISNETKNLERQTQGLNV